MTALEPVAAKDAALEEPVARRSVRRAKRVTASSGGISVLGLLPLVIALGVWQLVGGSKPYFPPPSDWWTEIHSLNSEGKLWSAIRATLESFGFALGACIVAGTILGYLVGSARLIDRALSPTLEFIRYTPVAAIVPLAVLLAGYNEKMKVVVVLLGSIWPILLQVRAGTRAIPRATTDLAQALHMSTVRYLRVIVLPILVPSVLLGVRIAAPTTLILVLLVEITTNVPGIGSLITTAQSSFNIAAVYGLIAIASLVGLAINGVIVVVTRILLRYRPT